MTVLLGVLIGICGYAAVNHLVVGMRGERRLAHATMAAAAGASAFYVLCTERLFAGQTLEVARAWSRIEGLAAALLVIAAFWFARTMLGGWSNRVFAVVVGACAVVGIVSLLEPAGIFYGDITALQRVEVGALGQVTLPVATPNSIEPLFDMLAYVPLVYVLVRVFQVFRAGQRKLAAIAAIALLLPAVPALVDTFVLGVRTFPFPATETGLALGMVFLSLVVSEDVARTAGLKQKLGLSEARHRWLVETAPEAICEYDVDRHRFTLVNSRAGELFGRSTAEIVETDPVEILGGRSPQTAKGSFQDLVRRVLAGESPVVEWDVNRPDGSRVPCELRLSALPSPSGSLVRVSLLDISGRKQEEARQAELESRIRRSDRLQTIGTLAEGIAHDFNNILTPIVGFGELAAEDLDSHPAASYVEEMRASATQARELVRQILTFRRERAPEREVLTLAPVVKQALRFLRAALPQGVMLESALEAPVARVEGNATKVHQIIMNLGLNAAHAMDDQGTLRVTLQEVGEEVELTVTDNGSGMDEETVKYIFDPFFTTKAPGRGTGLGLSVVRGIVRDWSGHIDVDTTPGVGTTFRIRLPIVGEDAAAAASAVALRTGTETILVIDDDASAGNVVRGMLRSLGYRVILRADPREALLALDPEGVHACITDFDMPHMDGIAFSERLRHAFPQLPVILTSGSAEGLERAPTTNGPWFALAKPFGRGELSQALRAVLGDPAEAEASTP